MRKPLIKFKQLPDQLSRFRVIYSEIEYLKENEEVLDPYPYFYDERYNVEIYMLDGRLFDNYDRTEDES